MRLNFTRRVLGPMASRRLKHKMIKQTIRSANATIPQALKNKEITIGAQVEVFLDEHSIGLVQLTSCRATNSDKLTETDATRGGFDSLGQLVKVLKKAGYRFMPLDKYPLHRIQFKWI